MDNVKDCVAEAILKSAVRESIAVMHRDYEDRDGQIVNKNDGSIVSLEDICQHLLKEFGMK